MKFKKFNSIGSEEIEIVTEVLRSGLLSEYVAESGDHFFGGRYVRLLESQWAEYFRTKHAILFNSWTSGLIAAVGTLDIEPGDEIIVTPWTMSASAMAILHWNAIPVFADINRDTYCLDLESVRSSINPRTKAIMSVDIFGQSADAEGLMKIASDYGLKVISDSAQSPGALRNGRYAGTLTDIGGFSLNHHKHIHTGEGGVLVTNNDDLALRAQLIRNHAESVVGPARIENLSNMVGYNFRMTEIEAAIGIVQLPKLKQIAAIREKQGQYFSERLGKLPGFIPPKVDIGNTHVYYSYAFQINPKIVKVTKEIVVSRLTESGVPNLTGCFPNLHLLPIFQNKIAYGNNGFPWNLTGVRKDVSYAKGICPVAEDLLDNTFIQFYFNEFELSESDLNSICEKFELIWPTFL